MANSSVPRNSWPSVDSEKHLQGDGHFGQRHGRSLSGFLRRLARQRHETVAGSSHPGAQNRGHHFDRLEERSTFRRRTSETTSSLSASRRALSIAGSFWVVASRVLETLGFEGEYQPDKLGPACLEHRAPSTSSYEGSLRNLLRRAPAPLNNYIFYRYTRVSTKAHWRDRTSVRECLAD